MIQQYLSGASTEPQGYLNGDSMGLNQHYNLKFSNFSFRYLFEVNFFFPHNILRPIQWYAYV